MASPENRATAFESGEKRNSSGKWLRDRNFSACRDIPMRQLTSSTDADDEPIGYKVARMILTARRDGFL